MLGPGALECLEIAGDPNRVSEWLGRPVEGPLEDVKVDWVGATAPPDWSRRSSAPPPVPSASDVDGVGPRAAAAPG